MQKAIQDVQGDHRIVMAMGYGLVFLFYCRGTGNQNNQNNFLIKCNSLAVHFEQRVHLFFVTLIMSWVFINSLHSASQSYIFLVRSACQYKD